MYVLCLLSASLIGANLELQTVLNAAQPGQVIDLPDGIYNGAHLVDRRFDPPVTFRAAGLGRVAVTDGSTAQKALWLSRSAGLRFENIVFYSRTGYALHVDGVGQPTPNLSSNMTFTNCKFIALGPLYAVKLSQAEILLFDQCGFYIPEKSVAQDGLGGCLDAVAVDHFIIRDCMFDNQRDHTTTLMIKGGSRGVMVRGCTFQCPGEPTFHLAGPTRPDFRARDGISYELEKFTFRDNRVFFRDSNGENLHGVWDSLGHAQFLNNEFHNVGHVLFVAKRTHQDLRLCEDITFKENKIIMRPSGFANPYSALITTQNYQKPGDPAYLPILPKDEFHAEGNMVLFTGKSDKPETNAYTEKGFEFSTGAAADDSSEKNESKPDTAIPKATPKTEPPTR